MPRIRSLKPEFFKHPEMCDLPVGTRYFFAGLWCQADRDGRMKDRPRLLKLEIAPWDDIDPEIVLAELAKAGFVQRYEVDGERYISIRHFAKHQRPHPKEPKSEIPPPPKSSLLVAVERNGATRPAVESNGTPPKQDLAVEKNGEPGGLLSLGSCLLSLGSGGKAGGRDLRDLELPRPAVELHGSAPDRAAEPETPPPPIPPVPEKPESPPDLLAAYLAATWRIPKALELATAWRLKWRAVDLLSEAKKARAYEQETGKLHDSPAAFLRGWMRRAAENPGQSFGNGAPAGPTKTARQRAEETSRALDAKDRGFREEQASADDPKGVVARLWLYQRWPQEFPQYAPPEASAVP